MVELERDEGQGRGDSASSGIYGLVGFLQDLEDPERQPSGELDEAGAVDLAGPGSGSAPAAEAIPEPAAGSEADRDDAGPPEPIESRRTHWSTEVALLLLIAVLLERAVGEAVLGFHDWHPHPYWALVGWIAIRRGLVPALWMALCATVFFALGIYRAGHVSGLVELLDLQRMAEPLGFFGLAWLAGGLRDDLAERFAALVQRCRQQHEELARRRRDLQLLSHVNRELKRRIFDHPADFDNLIAAVGRIETVTESDLFDLPLSMLQDYCGATRCSVLVLLEDGTVDLAAHRGWNDDEIKERIAEACVSPQVRRAIREAQPVVAVEPGQEIVPSGPLMVAPIADVTGVIKALLCLDEMPPGRFQDATVSAFLSIAEWVAASLRRHQKGRSQDPRTAMQQILHSNRSVGTPQELSNRIYLEDARRSRHGIPASFLAVQAVELQGQIPGFLDRMDRFLIDNLCTQVRLSDDLYRFGYPACYVFVLAGADAEGADVVARRMRDRLREKGTGEFGPLHLRVFAPDEECPDLASLLPRLTEWFHGLSKVPLEPRCPVPFPQPPRPGDATAFARRLRMELEIARRHGLELNLIDFRGDDEDVDVGAMVARHLWNSTSRTLRATDGIFVLGPKRCVVVMPGTNCLDATRAWQRLQHVLRKTIPEDRYRHIHTDFLALAENDLRDAARYLVGEGADVETRPDEASVLSDLELSELQFSDLELSHLGTATLFEAEDGQAPSPGGDLAQALASLQAMARERDLPQDVQEAIESCLQAWLRLAAGGQR